MGIKGDCDSVVLVLVSLCTMGKPVSHSTAGCSAVGALLHHSPHTPHPSPPSTEGIVEVVKIFTGSSRPRASRTPAMPTSPTPAAPSPLAPLPPLANPLLSPLSSAATADLSTLTAATSLATASSGAGMQVESSKGEDAGVVVGAVAVGQGLSETAVQGVGGGVDASPAYMSRVSADGSMGGATERVGAERGRRWSGAGGGRDAPPKYHPRAERYR